jgi:hypothetical protein
MSKLSGADVCRLLNCLFLKARLKVRLLARVPDHRPRLRLHCFATRIPSLATTTNSMTPVSLPDCAKMTSPWDLFAGDRT